MLCKITLILILTLFLQLTYSQDCVGCDNDFVVSDGELISLRVSENGGVFMNYNCSGCSCGCQAETYTTEEILRSGAYGSYQGINFGLLGTEFHGVEGRYIDSDTCGLRTQGFLGGEYEAVFAQNFLSPNGALTLLATVDSSNPTTAPGYGIFTQSGNSLAIIGNNNRGFYTQTSNTNAGTPLNLAFFAEPSVGGFISANGFVIIMGSDYDTGNPAGQTPRQWSQLGLLVKSEGEGGTSNCEALFCDGTGNSRTSDTIFSSRRATFFENPIEHKKRLDAKQFVQGLKNLRPVYHTASKDINKRDVNEKEMLGLHPEDLEQLIPDGVIERNGVYYYGLQNLVPHLVEAIKEQDQEIEDLKQEVAKNKLLMEEVLKQLEDLKQKK